MASFWCDWQGNNCFKTSWSPADCMHLTVPVMCMCHVYSCCNIWARYVQVTVRCRPCVGDLQVVKEWFPRKSHPDLKTNALKNKLAISLKVINTPIPGLPCGYHGNALVVFNTKGILQNYTKITSNTPIFTFIHVAYMVHFDTI